MPELEEREAAIFSGYTWKEWRDLPREERIAGIAHYRVHHLIELHTEDAISKVVQMRQRGNSA